MSKLMIALPLLLLACVDETNADGPTCPTAIEMCGEPPVMPEIAISFDADRASMPIADYEQLSYYLGIEALWRSCVDSLR